MPGIYASRASKFLYLDGARMTGEAGPLTKSESETELLTEKILPEGSARAVVVQSGLSNEMITLEGYARQDSGAANLILSGDAHAVAATPDRLVTVGEFGDVVGQQATIHRAMTLADGWKTIPGELLLQFAGTLKTARGQTADVQEGTIIRAMAKSSGANDTVVADIKTQLVDLGAESAAGIVLAYHVEQIEFKDRAKLTLGVYHSTSATATPVWLAASDVVIPTTGANAINGPFGFWVAKAGTVRKFIAPVFVFGGAGSATNTSATFHVAVARL